MSESETIVKQLQHAAAEAVRWEAPQDHRSRAAYEALHLMEARAKAVGVSETEIGKIVSRAKARARDDLASM